MMHSRTAIKLVMLVMLSLVTCGSSHACPNIEGYWKTGGGGGIWHFGQNGCSIESTFQGHSLTGDYENGVFEYQVERTLNGCSVTFYGTIDSVGRDRFQTHVFRTSGGCGFAEGWQENLQWFRAK